MYKKRFYSDDLNVVSDTGMIMINRNKFIPIKSVDICVDVLQKYVTKVNGRNVKRHRS